MAYLHLPAKPRTQSAVITLRDQLHAGQREQQRVCLGVIIILAKAYAELGQFDDAWRCIGEAMTLIETNKGNDGARPRSIAWPAKSR